MNSKVKICITLLTFLIIASCSKETTSGGGNGNEKTGRLSMNIDFGPAMGRALENEDEIHTARIIVFDDTPHDPKVDINEYFDQARMSAGQDYTETSNGFKSLLKVNANDNKMVVVLANEPAILKTRLDAIRYPSELELLMLDLAGLLSGNHTEFLPGMQMPMSGAIRNITVTEQNDYNNPVNITISVERALARVDIYLKAGVNSTVTVSPETSLSLERTFDKAYYPVGTEKNQTRYQNDDLKDFGLMLTVDPSSFVSKKWTSSGTQIITETDGKVYLRSFYTPERTCHAFSNSDKLILEIENIGVGGVTTGGRILLDEFTPSGGSAPVILEYIKRNNIYEITGIISNKESGFTGTVSPWKKIPQNTIIDPQFELVVSQDECYFDWLNPQPIVIDAETDYDITEQGYPEGIFISIDYGDPQNTGWLTLTDMSGSDGSLVRTFELTSAINHSSPRSAVLKVQAGNMIKGIKVVQEGAQESRSVIRTDD